MILTFVSSYFTDSLGPFHLVLLLFLFSRFLLHLYMYAAGKILKANKNKEKLYILHYQTQSII